MTGLLLITVLLLLCGGPAYAEWTELGISGEDKDESTNYFDMARIRRAGHLAIIRVLYDYTTTQTIGGKSYLSIKGLRQFNCQEGTWRILAAYLHSEHMGNGNIQRSDTDARKWQPVVPESVADGEWKLPVPSSDRAVLERCRRYH